MVVKTKQGSVKGKPSVLKAKRRSNGLSLEETETFAKMKVLSSAIGEVSVSALIKAFLLTDEKKKALHSKYKKWLRPEAVYMKNVSFFEVVATVDVRFGRETNDHGFMFEGRSALELARASLADFISWLQPPFNAKYKANKPKESPGTREMAEKASVGIAVYSDWDQFLALLDKVERGPEEQDCDLRIASLSFTNSDIPQDKFLELVRRGVRIRIILADPLCGGELVRIRHQIRPDRTPQQALAALVSQCSTLEATRSMVRQLGLKGDLDFQLSSLLPYGFVALTSQLAVLGLFLADRSYGAGPMIVFKTAEHKKLCSTLESEWDIRWDHAAQEAARPNETRRMAEFFGATPGEPQGAIVLQEDSHETLLPGSSNMPRDGQQRTFKARRWIDSCDTEGALALIKAFNQRKCVPPAILLSRRNIPADTAYPFEIVLGGFTHIVTRDMQKNISQWLGFHTFEDCGDTILLNTKLDIPKKYFVVEDNGDGFQRILPRDWSTGKSGYMERWAKKVEFPNAEDVDDFAFILRRTETHPEKVRWFLVGFTEVGTKAACAYLAKHWPDLSARSAGGDFFTLLFGPSDPFRVNEWKAVYTVTNPELQQLGLA